MTERPICEPIELAIGTSLIAERVTTPANSGQSGHFVHYHDVVEIVVFRRVSGHFIADGLQQQLAEGAVAFIPSMHQHDFALDAGAKEWLLVQADPFIVESIASTRKLACFGRPFLASVEGELRARIDVVASWLLEAANRASDSAVGPLLELLLLLLAEAPRAEAGRATEQGPHFDRLLPALERLRSDPAAAIDLSSAAAMCRLSPAYFSRRFTQLLGMGFSDYVRTYRLHLAARRIVTSRAAISEIAYQTGFRSPAHFTARFGERFGMTPREYRNRAGIRGAVEGA